MTVSYEYMDKLEKIQTDFNNAKSTSCYSNAGTWNSAFEKICSFINVALKLSKPFIIAFFIIGIAYLVAVLIVLAIAKANDISPCELPYLNSADWKLTKKFFIINFNKMTSFLIIVYKYNLLFIQIKTNISILKSFKNDNN